MLKKTFLIKEALPLYKCIWNILSQRLRKAILLGAALAVLCGVLENINILIFAKMFTTLSQSQPYTHQLHSVLRHQAFAFIAITLAAGLFRVLSLWSNTKIAYKCGAYVSSQVFSSLIKKDYPFFVQHSTSALSDSMTTKSGHFAIVINYLFSLVSTITIGFGVILAILIDKGAIAILVFGLIGFIYIIAGKYLGRQSQVIGSRLSLLTVEQLRLASEAFRGIRELKIYGDEQWFYSQFERVCNDSSEQNSKAVLCSSMLKPLIEPVIIAGLILIAIFLLGLHILSSDQLLSALGVIVFGVVKTLPLFQGVQSISSNLIVDTKRIKTPLSYIDYNSASRHEVSVDFDNWKSIKFRNVSFGYENMNKAFIKNLSCEIKRGENIAVIGPSGSGKSTIIELLCGLLQPSTGQVLVDCISLGNEDARYRWMKQIAYVPQHPYLSNETIIKNLYRNRPIGPECYNEASSILELLGMEDWLRNLPFGLDTNTGEDAIFMSGGQKQRLAIARALLHNRSLLVLDEALSGLDPNNKNSVLDLVLKLPVTTVLVTHDLQYVDRFSCILNPTLLQSSEHAAF